LSKKQEVVDQPRLPHGADGVLAIKGEPLYRVLGVIVIPRYTIVPDEGEQLVPVLFQSGAQRLRGVRP